MGVMFTNSHTVSNKLCLQCVCSKELNSRGMTTRETKKRKNTVHTTMWHPVT